MSSSPLLAPAAPVGLDRVIVLARGASTLIRTSGRDLWSAIEDYAIKVGELLEVDALCLTSWEPGQTDYRLRVEWFRAGFRCVPVQRSGDHLLEQFPWFAAEIRRQGYFAVDDASELPAGASGERRHLEWIGRRAIATSVELQEDGSGVALTVSQGARPRRWSATDIDDVRTANAVLSAALRRFDSEAAAEVDHGQWLRSESRAVAVLDSALQRLLSVNEQFAALHGYEPRDLVGESLYLVSPERNSPHAMMAISRLRTHGRYVFEVMHRRADGSLFPCRIDASRVDAPDGSVCFIAAVTDRSVEVHSSRRREEPEDSAAANNAQLRGLGLLAGGIAHDFNNLLVGILGNAELARLGVPEGSASARALDDLRAAATRASGLANQMLAYAGKRRLNSEQIDLRAELRDVAVVLGSSLYQGATLRLDCEEDVSVVADATHTRQILMNLVVNASDAMATADASGEIVLRAGRAESPDPESLAVSFIPEGHSQFVYFEVEDDGGGMPEAVRRRIFDPFFTTKVSGRGLGMATVLECVRAHGGGVEVHSVVGQGTRIRVYFPDVGSKPAAERQPLARPVAESQPRRGKVLIAEDEDVVRTLLRRLLERRGLTVLEARDGVEAHAQFEDHDDIDLAMVDVSMPRMDGLTLLDSLGPENTTPIVLMSGYSAQDIRLRRTQDREVVFLQKPFETWELDELVDRFVEQ